jgi:hypothetical protein
MGFEARNVSMVAREKGTGTEYQRAVSIIRRFPFALRSLADSEEGAL